ncbi:hypothetical protein HMPREF0973_01373 [Prevotella veroralis F0319]|uniref:Uncharacterized protein n=1 Tax=Prevotella veroralis F0319 TaxID=649761 RepID=C9MP35_9BACT|nr:hypothetical protein HMPREF0973_01373 [Prevotella veroralis F0319]
MDASKQGFLHIHFPFIYPQTKQQLPFSSYRIKPQENPLLQENRRSSLSFSTFFITLRK